LAQATLRLEPCCVKYLDLKFTRPPAVPAPAPAVYWTKG